MMKSKRLSIYTIAYYHNGPWTQFEGLHVIKVFWSGDNRINDL